MVTAEPPSHTALIGRARRIARELAVLYPDVYTELNFKTPLELLVATILSAQTTDKRVNLVTPTLFARYPTAADYAGADREELEKIIQSTGFYHAKSTSLMGLGQALCERFGGEVPGRLKDLVTLPGVGRKTANVVLGNAFGVPGITVDTHFGRLARRFGWTTDLDPVKVEAQVATLIPRKDWTDLSQRMIWHGRRVCHAQRPACGACGLAPLCPPHGIRPTDPKGAAKLVQPGRRRAARSDRGGRPGSRRCRRGGDPPGGLHRADRVPGRPGAGLVAHPVRGGPGRRGRGGRGGTRQRGRTGRSRHPPDAADARRAQQPGVPGARVAHLGLHRRAGGPAARAGRLGEAVGRQHRRRLVKFAHGLDNGENAIPLARAR